MRSERRLHWTTRDYFDLEAHCNEKHEFLDGEIFAMGGARGSHNLVAMNTGAAFGFLLRGRPCKPFNRDQRIHIPATGLYTYPDGGVVCDRVEPAVERVRQYVDERSSRWRREQAVVPLAISLILAQHDAVPDPFCVEIAASNFVA